jgi:hypothetical protein
MVGAKKLAPFRGVSGTKKAEGEKKQNFNYFLNAKSSEIDFLICFSISALISLIVMGWVTVQGCI